MLFRLLGTITLVLLMQTDMMDLLGSDLPVESDEDMKFAWSDGILLQVKECFNVKVCISLKLADPQLCYFYRL